ncbi:MAG TPA: uroporphyrinogen decarboxylase family protein [Dehalococcoidales bacterium]|nr:uroporphyrinogen decarboxylase family protein [Dehalococcoidales bacterium]
MFKDPDIGKSAQQLRQERQKRINDAIDVKVPDRVPISCPMGNFPAKYTGVLCSAAYYDYDSWYDAYEKTLKVFRPDTFGAGYFRSGKALEILDPRTMRWPGHGVDPNHGFQSIEVESLKADEFDRYMQDPTDYLFRHHLSRVSNGLKGLAELPPLYNLLAGPAPDQFAAEAFAKPEVAKALQTLLKAGREMRRWHSKQVKFQKLLEKYGYFTTTIAAALPPYDIVSHSLRGMTGTMFDMFRQPDKLLELCDFILKKTLETIRLKPDENGRARIFMTNTRGSDEFLSKKQFDTFYWPTFKKLVWELCNRGGTPYIFFEGRFDSRLEYLLEFPKGKFVARFDNTDIFRAKEILKGHCCIEGNIPSSLLQVGTKDEVIAYCKKLIDGVGKDGGYIISPRSSTDEVKPENLKAMIDFTKEYGVYR